jgi:hypothetical protein
MTTQRDLKQLIRNRMAKTGESYTAARRHFDHATEAPAASGAPIKGWFAAGAAAEDYEVGIDPQGYQHASSARIRSREGRPAASWTTLMQHFLADAYREKRLRLSGWLRSEGVTGSCLLWMRHDENVNLLLYATSSPLSGSSPWTRREVVLDVDPEATLISIGLKLVGPGTAWLSDVSVDTVGRDVPVTASRDIPAAPTNLSFGD